MKKTELEILLEKEFPEKTPQAIQLMITGFNKVIRKELLKKLRAKNTNSEILKIIEEF